MVDYLLDHSGRLLTSKEISEMIKDDKGKLLVKEYCISAKIAHAVQQTLDYLLELDKRPSEMTYDDIQKVCAVLYNDFRYTKWDKIEKYLVEISKEAKLQGFPDLMGDDKDMKSC